MADAQYYLELLRPVFEGRKVIVCAEILQAAAGLVPFLRDAGAQRPLLLAGIAGTGSVPSVDEAEQVILGLRGDGSMMGSIRAFESALRDLPANSRAALDTYDPDGNALVVGSLFTLDGTVAGRRVYGGRRRSWEALEDKTVIGDVLAQANVDLARSEVVFIPDASRAAAQLDEGLGTAWAGDARDGWWGGASYFKWVRDDDDAAAAETFFSASCDRVRVMPFLEGIPCSIHGAVFDDAVIAFRPVEMLTLRRTDRNELLYAGVASYWDPPDADREAMREAARRVGRTLRTLVEYRGIFTLDGVLSSEGFRPTEVNPRPGAGLTPLIAASEVNLMLLHKAIVKGESFDWRPADLERLVVTAADAKRGGSSFTLIPKDTKETESVPVAKRAGRYVRLPVGETGDGDLVFGPSVTGGLVRYAPDVERVPKGPSFAPTVAEIFAFTDDEFGTGIGRLAPARSVR